MLTPTERAEAAVRLLEQEYPDAICALQYTKDYELLFATRLSAQCTDARVNIVTQELYARFPSLEAFAQAQPEEIEAVIRPCGLGKTKARDLHAAAQYLLDHHGGKVPRALELGELLVRAVGPGRQADHALAVELVELGGVRDKEVVPEHLLGRVGKVLVVEPVGAAEVGDAARRGDAGTAKEHRPSRP